MNFLASNDLRARIGFGLNTPTSPEARKLVEELASALGPSAVAVIHYGSKARGVDARADSAYDFFAIVDDYKSAYEALSKAMPIGRSPRTARSLARILTPNVHAIPPVPDGRRRNKCGILTLAALKRASRLDARDHFVAGRLFQHVQLSWAREAESERLVRECLIEIRARTFAWGCCFLPATFDAESYCRSLLETSFGAEIRAESDERAGDLFEAQRSVLIPVYEAVLEGLARDGLIDGSRSSYRLHSPPAPQVRRRWERYFRRSKNRATVRWGKAILLYDGWLDYLVQKITRHNDVQVELTERERRWPLIFLWPKVFLYFRERSTWEPRR